MVEAITAYRATTSGKIFEVKEDAEEEDRHNNLAAFIDENTAYNEGCIINDFIQEHAVELKKLLDLWLEVKK